MRLTPYQKAIREANKRLPFLPHRETKRLLEFAADDIVDAYRIGAEEAQREIVKRLCALSEREKEAK